MPLSEAEKYAIIARMFELFTPQQLVYLLDCADMIRSNGGFGNLTIPLKYSKPTQIEASLEKVGIAVTVSKKDTNESSGKQWADALKHREEIPDGKTRKVEQDE